MYQVELAKLPLVVASSPVARLGAYNIKVKTFETVWAHRMKQDHVRPRDCLLRPVAPDTHRLHLPST